MIGAIIGGVASLAGVAVPALFGSRDNRAALDAQAEQARAALQIEREQTRQAQLANQRAVIDASSTAQLAKVGLVSAGVLAFGAVSAVVVLKL